MSDYFLRIGRGLNNVNFGISALLSLGLIGGGIYFLVNKNADPRKVDPNIPSNEPPNAFGIAMVLFGVILLAISWTTRRLVRKNDDFARFVGMIDIFNILKS